MRKIDKSIPQINQSFSNFLNNHNNVILKLYNIVASFKETSLGYKIPDTFKYSKKYPPHRSNYKYTDKLFIGCILYVALYSSSWSSFIGPIPGKQVHKKFMEYSSMGIFKQFFNDAVEKYLMNENKIDNLSVDSTIIHNRHCKELKYKVPYLKNKKCVKLSTVVDSKGTPLYVSINDSGIHDSKILIKDFPKLIKNRIIKRKIYKDTTLLADKGYDTQLVRDLLNISKMKHIIPYNKRNTKDPSKIKLLTEEQKKIYKKRVKVENLFGNIKRYPKINIVYDKTLHSYTNIVYLVLGRVTFNRC